MTARSPPILPEAPARGAPSNRTPHGPARGRDTGCRHSAQPRPAGARTRSLGAALTLAVILIHVGAGARGFRVVPLHGETQLGHHAEGAQRPLSVAARLHA